MKNIVIVESPAKAKTIEKFLGSGFQVESSFGHVRDLEKKNMGIDVHDDFNPHYEISPRSKKVITTLKKAIKGADQVWLATDEDREGEAIAWHLAEVLNLNTEETNRITFNEITSKAVKNAIEKPRKINLSLVNAQQARRIVDRLVGFELSPVLWKKVRPGLSAGRVQSVSVRLILEKEAKRRDFAPEITWKMTADLQKDGNEFKGQWHDKEVSEQAIEHVLNYLCDKQLVVQELVYKLGERSPSAPFITSSLQQTASQAFSYTIKKTMSVAQRLYESGFITYMRTDSVNLSDEALDGCAHIINELWGSEYHRRRTYKSKLSSAQEAHEAIRPTDFSRQRLSKVQSEEENKLYQLIWQRAVSSQMANAKIKKTTVNLGESGLDGYFVAVGEIVDFEGWLKAQPNKYREAVLPSLAKGDQVTIEEIMAREVFSRPPARYTEGSLVKKLEELGIGRPSTYAPIITTIQERGYIEKGDTPAYPREYNAYLLKNGSVEKQQLTENTGAENKQLIPTDMAFVVNNFLVKQFPDVIDYQFTAKLEQDFDHIANDHANWREMVEKFYKPFHLQVVEAESIEREKINYSRQIGVDPQSNRPMTVRLGRYGPFVQIGDIEDEQPPVRTGLRRNQRMETISLEEALKLFELPKTLGVAPKRIAYRSIDGTEYELEKDAEIKVNIGRFGPFIQFGTGKYVSLKGVDPEDIEFSAALEIVEEHLKKKAEQLLAYFSNIKVLSGYWGPYLSDGEKNAPLGKTIKVEDLDEEKAQKILAEKGKPTRRVKKPTTKKATAKKATAKKATAKKATAKKATATKATAKKATATKATATKTTATKTTAKKATAKKATAKKATATKATAKKATK